VAVSNAYGDIMILNYNNLNERITTLKRPKQWCEVMQYSPCGNYLAVGSHDTCVYIYEITDKQYETWSNPASRSEYTLFWAINHVHQKPIISIDWSRSSELIRTVDSSYRKLFFNVPETFQVVDGALHLTALGGWDDKTAQLGWDKKNLYIQCGVKLDDINSMDVVGKEYDSGHLVVGDNFGTMCLFNYPVREFDPADTVAPGVRMTGHSDEVRRVRTLNTDAGYKIITAGGNDRTLIQWKHNVTVGNEAQNNYYEEEEE